MDFVNKVLGGNIKHMSGHSKWSTIKRDKSIADSKRGKVFTKMANMITVTAKKGGGDPDSNASLRHAIEKAKSARMPKENIIRAINRGAGRAGDGGGFEDVIYEGFGPKGEAFLIKVITDNKNRIVAEVRGVFSRLGGSLGGQGSTSYIFSPDPNNPSFYVEAETSEQKEKIRQLSDRLVSLEDVQEVYVNLK